MNPARMLTASQRWLLSLFVLAAMMLLSFGAQAQQIPAWAPNTPYAINAKVTYQGSVYQCRQAHTSLVTWEPPATPALWLNIGADNGNGADTQAPTAPSALRSTAVTATTLTSGKLSL